MNTATTNSRNWLGILLITLGIVFLLDTLNVFGKDTSIISDFWPVIIIAAGLVGWAQRGFAFVLGPILVFAVGVLLLAGNLTDADTWQFWPVVLIIIGAWFVWKRNAPLVGGSHTVLTGSGTVNITSFMGGNEQRVMEEFRGGRVTAIMGGGALDLREATLPADGALLEVNAVMGGFELRVPEEWQVVMNANAFLAGIEDKRRSHAASTAAGPALTITGSIFMGGLEITS